ncbi:MAG: outer membrane beta-barrel protein, partial [Elusimicrobia bacterium]|nr:outer membrane beta-barrel protein [Elusimicrobiota bacterium]
MRNAWGILAAAFPVAGSSARAQEARGAAVRTELDGLRARVEAPEKERPAAGERLPVSFGGFLDTYYAYDFDRPASRARAFTTQPARHNEFDVNLAYIEAVVAADRVRGRLALQAGNSVQSNYAGEPAVGSVSGPSLTRSIQEAWAGYRVTEKLWVDAGICFSHIGMESFISRDNWTYSRSLMAEFSPYCQSGVRASYQFDKDWSAQLHVLNGWQN